MEKHENVSVGNAPLPEAFPQGIAVAVMNFEMQAGCSPTHGLLSIIGSHVNWIAFPKRYSATNCEGIGTHCRDYPC